MRKKILVVDDDLSVRESIMNALSYEDFLPLGAADGLEALEMIRGNEPDLVLLDLNMPRRNGWDTYQSILTEHPLLPVIIITARPNQLFTSLGAGVGALVEKPLDFITLLQTIRKLIEEPADQRLARLTGRASNFEYIRPNGNKVVYEKHAGEDGSGKNEANR